MARGKTLLKLLDDLRAESGLSLNPAHNLQKRDIQVHHLQRVQEWLWNDFDWPHLRVERRLPVVVGQRYYALPADLTAERLNWIEVFRDGCWVKLAPEITGVCYSTYNSDLNERAYPPRAWRLNEDDGVEIWPISDTAADPVTLDGTLRFIGIRNLRRFVDEADVADLDDRLIVLYAASEMLASSGDKAAQLKLAQAKQRYDTLRGELTKSRSFQMFRTGRAPERTRFVPNYRPPAVPT